MKLSKKSIAYRTASRFGAVLLFVILFAGPLGLILFAPLLAAIGIFEYFYWKKYDFFIEDGDIKITSGVITRNELDIPVRRVQNVDINRNFIHRIFDIAELKIETAGGSTTEASLRYLDLEDAEKLREEIRQLKDRRNETKEESEEDQDLEGESYELSDRNLALLALTNSAPSTAALTIILFTVGFGGLTFYMQGMMELVAGTVTLIIGVVFLATIGLLIGGLSTYTKYYDFKVERRNDVIEYEMGMINKQGGTIPKEKIQTLIIEENFLKRYFGYTTLKVETAGTNINDQMDTSTVLIPLDKTENVVEYAENIGKLQYPELENIYPKARTRYFRRYLISALITAIPASLLIYTGFNPVLLLLPLILAIAAKKAGELQWKNIGYQLGTENIFIMKGFWKRKTYIVPYFRVQNLMKTESIFQRRWDQASITIDTAGSIWTNPVIPDMDTEKASEVRAQLFKNFRNSIY